MTTPTLAVSNIAWEADEEEGVADLLAGLGLSAVEIAPTKVFHDPLEVDDRSLADYERRWRSRGIEIAAFQSMLFGHPELQLFHSAELRRATVERLAAFIVLAGRMGAGALVFGSPRNRNVPEGEDEHTVWQIAVDVFGELGEIARSQGTVLCIEPNPVAYGCNFVTDAAAGARLVRDVDHPGFRLHLDAAGMTLAGDDVGQAITSHADILRHYHVSAPELGPIETEIVDHRAAFHALRDSDYDRVVSIEMRGQRGGTLNRVKDAVLLTRSSAADAGLTL